MKSFILKSLFAVAFLVLAVSVNAQIKYRANGTLTIGNTEPNQFYQTTLYGNGMFFKCKTSNFFQIDLTPAATRLASHYDQVVFYNTQSGIYNSIQVKNVYNYSDARAKMNIAPVKNSLATLAKLNVVSYNFKDENPESKAKFIIGGDGKEVGLLAQEVEKVLPNAVLTDDEGRKLINYNAVFTLMLDAINQLKNELDQVKAGK